MVTSPTMPAEQSKYHCALVLENDEVFASLRASFQCRIHVSQPRDRAVSVEVASLTLQTCLRYFPQTI